MTELEAIRDRLVDKAKAVAMTEAILTVAEGSEGDELIVEGIISIAKQNLPKAKAELAAAIKSHDELVREQVAFAFGVGIRAEGWRDADDLIEQERNQPMDPEDYEIADAILKREAQTDA